MKRVFVQSLIVATSLLIAGHSYAHAPEFHKNNEAHPPNCDAIKHIDRSKVASDDVIMQAMLSQCANQHHEDVQHTAEASSIEKEGVEKTNKHH